MVINGTTGSGVSAALILVGVGLDRVAVGRERVGVVVGRRVAVSGTSGNPRFKAGNSYIQI